MRRYWRKASAGRCRRRSFLWPLMAALMAFALAVPAMAAGGKPATKIYNVADTRTMEGGLSKLIADIYNASLWEYAAVVVVVMATMGLVLGYGMDRLLVLLHINLGKLEHHE